MRVSLLVSTILILFASLSVSAGVPTVINYQGRLTDGGGAPVADGGYLVKFSIYDAAIGGSELWNSGFQNVTAESGLFSYDLGSNVQLMDDLFTDTARYLGITVGVDPEISPRTRLASTPFAYHALRADTAMFSGSSPGVTQVFDDGDVLVTGFLNVLATDSINCPADGFVMLSVTSGFNCLHTQGDEDVLFVLLTDSTFTITMDQDGHAWSVPAALPTGQYGNPMHFHKVFAVSAGWNEFSALASQNAGGGTDNFGAQDVGLSLLFIPQALGTVESITTETSNPELVAPARQFR